MSNTLSEAMKVATTMAAGNKKTYAVYEKPKDGYDWVDAAYFMAKGLSGVWPFIAVVEPDGTITYNAKLTAPTVTPTDPTQLETVPA